MANEVLVSTISDLMASTEVSTEVLYLLSDRDPSLLSHPALMKTEHEGLSNVIQVPHSGLGGYDDMDDYTPGSGEIANSAFSDGSTLVTIAPVTKRYTVGDFAAKLAAGVLSPMEFAKDLVIKYQQAVINKIANVGDDFTTTVGSTGVDISWDNILEAKGVLANAEASGGLLCVLHPQQWSDLEQAAMSLGVNPANSMGGTIMQGLQSYKGRYMGVDFFTSSKVPTANAGADRAGFMVTRGGIAWGACDLGPSGDPNIASFGPARLERVRRGTYLDTSWVQSAWIGASKALDGAGVSIVTDA